MALARFDDLTGVAKDSEGGRFLGQIPLCGAFAVAAVDRRVMAIVVSLICVVLPW